MFDICCLPRWLPIVLLLIDSVINKPVILVLTLRCRRSLHVLFGIIKAFEWVMWERQRQWFPAPSASTSSVTLDLCTTCASPLLECEKAAPAFSHSSRGDEGPLRGEQVYAKSLFNLVSCNNLINRWADSLSKACFQLQRCVEESGSRGRRSCLIWLETRGDRSALFSLSPTFTLLPLFKSCLLGLASLNGRVCTLSKPVLNFPLFYGRFGFTKGKVVPPKALKTL